MSEATRLRTAEELERFPSDDNRYELVEGRIVPMSPVGFEHGRVVLQLAFLLSGHLRNHPVGTVVTEVGFTLDRNPDTVRAPDIAFLRKDRTPRDPRRFFNGSPDVAIEVLSPDDRPSDVNEKVDGYLARGVHVVVVVDPDEKSVTMFRPNTPPVTLGADEDVLDLSDMIPGFRCQLREVFE